MLKSPTACLLFDFFPSDIIANVLLRRRRHTTDSSRRRIIFVAAALFSSPHYSSPHYFRCHRIIFVAAALFSSPHYGFDNGVQRKEVGTLTAHGNVFFAKIFGPMTRHHTLSEDWDGLAKKRETFI
jgi:hypothetical protein